MSVSRSRIINKISSPLDSVASLAVEDDSFKKKGYTFKRWTTIDKQETYLDSQNFILSEQTKNLYAEWEINKYKITWTNPTGGTIHVTDINNKQITKNTSIEYNSIYKVVCTPTNDSYILDHFAINGQEYSYENNGHLFTVGDNNIIITAVFNEIQSSQDTYTISFIGDNYSKSSNTSSILEGGSYECIITPDTDYEIKSIVCTMNGVRQEVSNNTISISNVIGNIIVTIETQLIQDDSSDTGGDTGGDTQKNSVLTYCANINPEETGDPDKITVTYNTDSYNYLEGWKLA